MKVRGILVEGNDSNEYLLGAAKRARGKTKGPFIARREGNAWRPFETTRDASDTIRTQLLGLSASIGNHDEHVKQAVIMAIASFLDEFLETARWGG